MTTERLLYPPTVFSYNWPERNGKPDPRHLKICREIPYECYLDAVKTRRVGDVIRSYASAPGTGYVEDRITRIDATGVYAIELTNTVRELTPEEVE